MPSPDKNPYATPSEATEIRPPLGDLKDPRPLAYLACTFYTIMMVGGTFVNWLPQIASPRAYFYSHLALGLGSIVLFLCWKYRAGWNAHLIDDIQMPETPGKCVGSYFIPLANLVVPYRAMRGIARTAMGKAADRHVMAWWTLVLICGMIPFYLSFVVQFAPASLPGPTFLTVLGQVLRIARWLLFAAGISLVMRITRAQILLGMQERQAPLTPDAQ